MQKILVGVFVGIFVGALAVEVLNRKKPGLAKEIEKKAKDTVDAFVATFKKGLEVEDDETKPIRPERSPA